MQDTATAQSPWDGTLKPLLRNRHPRPADTADVPLQHSRDHLPRLSLGHHIGMTGQEVLLWETAAPCS